MKLFLYTDGSSRGNPGPGGWGVYIEANLKNDERKEFKLSGGSIHTTNNRMELTAAIQGFRFLKMYLLNKYFVKKENLEKDLEIIFKLDSQYVKNGINTWIVNWQKNNWKGSNKKPVLNKDLWQELIKLKEEVNQKLIENNLKEVNFEYVKGHAGIIGNEIADELATIEADKFKS